MAVYPIYDGADYGLEKKYKDNPLGVTYQVPTGSFGFPTDPRSANQLDAVSRKLNTGAKTIEVSGITPQVFESIPDQHLEEINRLRKLAGADFTFHGVLVEPTGAKQGWDESDRVQAERQMMSNLERAQKINSDSDVIVTFHSSNGLPDPVSKTINPETGKEEISEVWVVNESEGRFQQIRPKEDYFSGKKLNLSEKDAFEAAEKESKEAWYKQLQHLNFNAFQGAKIIESALSSPVIKDEKIDEKSLLKFYSKFGDIESETKIKQMGEYSPLVREKMRELTHGEIYLKEAYSDMQKLYNQAYDSVINSKDKEKSKEDLEKLNHFRNEIKSKMKDLEKKENVNILGEEIIKGITLLRSINPPNTFKPLREFAIDKASDTFSNLALGSYNKFSKSESGHMPIISIENPPVGSGLSRGADLKELVEVSRQKFVEKAQKSVSQGGAGLSESEAKKQAERLLGVTWDVGHINMMRKLGYGDTALKKETEQVAKYVNKIHLSDNFGLDHTELPMGMGNVPLAAHLEVLRKQFGEKVKDIKHIVETGNWFEPFKSTPVAETLSAFGSPIYSMKMSPNWSQGRGMMGGYFSGYGAALPEVHFSTYGAGFSGLPQELGGQIGGRSRISGAPMD